MSKTKTVVRPKQARQMLGDISHSTLWRLTKAGKLNKVQIGERAVGYKLSDIENYINNNVIASNQRGAINE